MEEQHEEQHKGHPHPGTSLVPAPAGGSVPTRRHRWLGSVIAILALAALAGFAWYLTHPTAAADGASGASAAGRGGPGGGGGRGGRGGPVTTVGVASAELADIPIWLDALGTVTPSATVTVRPQVSGVMKQVMFKEGQMVHAGQLLAMIDARPFEMAVMQSEGQRLRDQAQLDNAKLTLQRFQTLLQQDSIARQDVDTQAALVKQLEGTVMSDKASEGTARLNLNYTRIVAPVSGRVGLRSVDVGNVVSPGDANGIAVITQLAPIDVEFSVPQDRVPDVEQRVAQGATLPVTAYDRTRTKELDKGTFSTLNNQVDTQTGTVRAKARFANPKSTLFPSQFVNVRVLLDTIAGAVVVPTTALRHGSDGDFVYVLNDDRTVALRKVTQGQATGDRVAIASGLAIAEKVITEGADRLKDGARVQLPDDRPASGAFGGRGGAWGNRASGPRGGGSSPWAGRDRAGTAADAASGASNGASRPHRRHASEVVVP
ncbi:MAG: MdtA/MuxA family multidrug efflux RND transporter periplasmic adaptor subunit [Burkholderiales bacterium]|jgi:membrane fusion protein, multidrug efflux system|nr:MdtA/MuxA family multidrug efflux RND transporter periplasmic adaptor subunit [Burkholderiales bacterium]